jgi:predicted Rossmann fold flavoprotein
MIHKFDVVVLGAGAAGLMCAMEAGKRGRRVAVLERAERPGKKILISGGGRCNFTNTHCQPENFLSANPHFAKSALARYTPADFVALVEKHQIPYHEKTLGQLFCDRSANEITHMLESECRVVGAKIYLNVQIRDVQRTEEFLVRADADEFQAPVLVVATGGLSIPKMAATSLGYDLARQFALKIQKVRPALVPLVFGAADRDHYCDLAGVSAEVVAAFGAQQFSGNLLITHRGLSGPAILQISSYWNNGGALHIDLAPGLNVTAAMRDGGVRNIAAARAAFLGVLPRRLATRWLELHAPAAKSSKDTWSRQELVELERHLHEWIVVPADTEGYGKAEVTAGGVDTDELSSKTMESAKVRGLFFIGEVVDVTGQLGGFNFQWAWASGAAAGRSV